MIALVLLLLAGDAPGGPPGGPLGGQLGGQLGSAPRNPLEEGWQVVGRRDGVVVYQRPRAHSPHPEVLAVGTIDVEPWVAKNAVDDVEGTFMPYLVEAQVLKRDERGLLIYNRVSPPLVTDRDYSIRFFDQSYTSGGVTVWIARWRAANDEGPPKRSGVVRVHETEGYWRFEPVDGGKRTRASYFVYTNPGGSVPAPLSAWGSTTMLPDVVNALGARAKQAKYRDKRPPTPSRSAPER